MVYNGIRQRFVRVTAKNHHFIIGHGYTPGESFIRNYFKIWLGRQDSNLGMQGSKPCALPLGDAPKITLLKRNDSLYPCRIAGAV